MWLPCHHDLSYANTKLENIIQGARRFCKEALREAIITLYGKRKMGFYGNVIICFHVSILEII